jgi:hypothetical protein
MRNCTICGESHHIIDLIINGDEEICNECVARGVLIRDYSYEPDNMRFYGGNKNSNALFMGIELEVDMCLAEGKLRNTACVDSNYWYMKHDSSLGRCGVELVSHPMTFEFLKRNPEIITNIVYLGYSGVESSSEYNCGLHIHLSKAAFGNYHLWKFLKFIYKLDNRKFIYFISERSYECMNLWAKIGGNARLYGRARSKTQLNLDRHHAVNLRRKATVELRIFSGTLDSVKLWSRIEFTHALYEFTKIVQPCDLNENSFRKYLKNKACYKNLAQCCLFRGVKCA